MLSLACFVVGGLVGWGAARGGTQVQRVWPVVLRAQILVTSATLSLFAAWRLTSPGQLVGPLVLAAGLWVMFGVGMASRGRRSPGEARSRRGPSAPTARSGWSRRPRRSRAPSGR